MSFSATNDPISVEDEPFGYIRVVLLLVFTNQNANRAFEKKNSQHEFNVTRTYPVMPIGLPLKHESILCNEMLSSEGS